MGLEIRTGCQVIRSDRKTIAIQIHPDGTVIVRCPKQLSERSIRSFVESKRGWIEARLAKQAAHPVLPAFTEAEIRTLAANARKVIPEHVAFLAPRVGVTYGRITIRSQHSRWGSCSGKGNLNFNCLLMLMPEEVLDYVVVHELCHRKEMNHSPRFWAEVERILPNFKESKKWLKENGPALIRRLP